MSKLARAEWLLAQASTPVRASEIVGDLLEQKLSPTRLWLNLSRILFTLTWRWLLGVCLVPIFSFAILLVATYTISRRRGPSASDPRIMLTMYLSNAAVCFGTVTALSASRYGVRDRLTWMSTALWTALVACTFLAWTPHAPYTIALLLTSVFAALLLGRRTRNLALCVILPAAVYTFTSDILARLGIPVVLPLVRAHNHISPAGWMTFNFAISLVAIIAEAIVLARLRSTLLSRSNLAEALSSS